MSYGYGRYGYGTRSLIQANQAPPPSFTTLPSAATGTPTEGQLLTAVPGVIANGTLGTIQWINLGEDIPGATGATYQARPGDTSISYRVTALGGNVGETVDAVAPAVAIAAAVGQTTFASYNGVTFNGTTAPTTGGAYTPDVIGGGTGQTAVFSGTNARIANGRLWFAAGCILGYGPQRADQSVMARFSHRSVVANTVTGVTLRNVGAASYNGYHLFWVQASNAWRLTNGNTASIGGVFTDIADAAFSASNEDRIVIMSAVGGQITYTVINPATGAVIGTRTGANATYAAAGWGGLRQQSTTASSETTGVTVDWCATFTDAQSTSVFLVDGPTTVPEDTASANFTAMTFGTPPAQLECFGTANGGSVATPSTALAFAAIHASHTNVRLATFTVTPPNEGNLAVTLSSVHVTARLPRDLFSISAVPPVIRAPFSVRRGANTPINAGDVNLNALLLTAGYVDNWNIAFVSATGGGLATDFSGIRVNQRRFPTPAPGISLAGKSYTLSFTSAENGAITTTVTVTCPANVVTISKPADITAALGAASSTNITNAGRTWEIARGSTGFAAAKLFVDRHNSQATSVTPLVLRYEDEAFAPVLAGVHLFNCNYVTVQNLKTSLTRAQGSALGTTHIYATWSTFFSLNDRSGIGIIVDGCQLNGTPGQTTTTCDGVVLNLSNSATPIVRNCIFRWIQNGIKTAGALATQTLTNNDFRYFTSNAMILTGSTGLTTINDNGFRSPTRDLSNDFRIINGISQADHIDALQWGDGSVIAQLEMQRNIYAAADGNAGCQGFFGGTTINAGFMARNIVMNPSGAHALRPATIAGTFSIHANTVIHQRRRYQANPLPTIDDTLTDGTIVTQTPGITVVSAQATNTIRRCWSQNQISVSAATIGVGVLTYRLGQTTNVIAANDPAACFTGWAEMAGYDWTLDRDLATFRSEVMRLVKPISTSAVHLGDQTYAGAIANNAGVAVWNDEAVYA